MEPANSPLQEVLTTPIGDFGGPTPTMALLPGSPAIDHGLTIWCPATDQRGIARPFGSACDIGAFEFKAYQLNALAIESYTNQILHLIFAGTNGQSFQVQTATNLSNWTDLVTNQAGTNGIFDFFYTNDLAEPLRLFQTYGR